MSQSLDRKWLQQRCWVFNGPKETRFESTKDDKDSNYNDKWRHPIWQYGFCLQNDNQVCQVSGLKPVHKIIDHQHDNQFLTWDSQVHRTKGAIFDFRNS